MNVLYIINFAGKGGSEKYIKNLASFLSNHGDNVFFCYNIKGLLAEQMAGIASDIFRLDMASPFDIKAAKAIAQYCDMHSIDIIHTQFARENYIAILSTLFGNKARIIHTCHINTYNNFIWRALNKFIAAKNFKVIAVCNSVRDLLIKNNYPPNKIDVIFNGIEYNEKNYRLSLINEEFGADGDSFIFITLARFSEEKGIFFLLEAAGELYAARRDFTLLMAGDGPLYGKAKEFVKTHGLQKNIILPGYRDDGDRLLHSAHCFINSSESEALSFAILEAMEAGLPVIATNVGGNPDIVNSATNCGITVNYGDVGQLSKAMANMIDNNREYEIMAQNSCKAVRDIFNIENSILKTYEIYKHAGAK